MKTPTREEIEAIIVFRADYINGHKTMSREIHALIHPPRKPLSELYLDSEACTKIAESLGYKFESVEPYPSNLSIRVSTGKGMLRRDGAISINYNGAIRALGDFIIKNHFEVIDFIRSLGYEPYPKS